MTIKEKNNQVKAKLKNTKKCVKNYLSNELTLKINGAKA